MWTKSSKTGLFGWRTTTSVRWSCPIKKNTDEVPNTSQTLGKNINENENLRGIEHEAILPGNMREEIS